MEIHEYFAKVRQAAADLNGEDLGAAQVDIKRSGLSATASTLLDNTLTGIDTKTKELARLAEPVSDEEWKNFIDTASSLFSNVTTAADLLSKMPGNNAALLLEDLKPFEELKSNLPAARLLAEEKAKEYASVQPAFTR